MMAASGMSKKKRPPTFGQWALQVLLHYLRKDDFLASSLEFPPSPKPQANKAGTKEHYGGGLGDRGGRIETLGIITERCKISNIQITRSSQVYSVKIKVDRIAGGQTKSINLERGIIHARSACWN